MFSNLLQTLENAVKWAQAADQQILNAVGWALSTLVIPVAFFVIRWLWKRPRYLAEQKLIKKQKDLAAAEEILAVVTAMKCQVEAQSLQIDLLRQDNATLKEQIKTLLAENVALIEKVEQLNKKLDQWKAWVNSITPFLPESLRITQPLTDTK